MPDALLPDALVPDALPRCGFNPRHYRGTTKAAVLGLSGVGKAAATAYDSQAVSHALTAGVGRLTASPGNPDAVAEVFRQADRALYVAKAAGRNQVVVYD